MEQVSQLILRNTGLLQSGKVLLINPPRDSAYGRLASGTRQVSIFTQDFGDHIYLSSSGATSEFGLIPSPYAATQDIVLILPRERERLEMLLHALASSMTSQSILWLAGENRSGIKSSAKKLQHYFQTVARVDSARHCTLFRACNPTPADPFVLEDYEKTWPLTFSGAQIDIVSLPGTFAHGKPDRGTMLLLDSLQELKPTGQVLDFACGSGVIGLSLLRHQPAIGLTLLDTSALALESARSSLRVNAMTAKIVASDGFAQLEGTFDWIISNPPFHRGTNNDLNVARHFFTNANRFLSESGKLLLVCNKHLPYTAWLKERFTRVEIVGLDRGFKVILASGIPG